VSATLGGVGPRMHGIRVNFVDTFEDHGDFWKHINGADGAGARLEAVIQRDNEGVVNRRQNFALSQAALELPRSTGVRRGLQASVRGHVAGRAGVGAQTLLRAIISCFDSTWQAEMIGRVSHDAQQATRSSCRLARRGVHGQGAGLHRKQVLGALEADLFPARKCVISKRRAVRTFRGVGRGAQRRLRLDLGSRSGRGPEWRFDSIRGTGQSVARGADGWGPTKYTLPTSPWPMRRIR